MFDDHWKNVTAGLEQNSQALLGELQRVLEGLHSVHRQLEHPAPVDLHQIDSLSGLENSWNGLQLAQFGRPRQEVEQGRLLAQVVGAFQRFSQGADDLARRSPQLLRLTGAQLGSALSGPASRNPWLVKLRRGERDLPMRAALVQESHRGLRAFLELATEFLSALSEGVHCLVNRWRKISCNWCQQLLDDAPLLPAGPLEWKSARAHTALGHLKQFCARLPRSWARALWGAFGASQRHVPPRDASPQQSERWASLLGQVQAETSVQLGISRGMVRHLEIFGRLNLCLQEELSSLEAELAGLKQWVACSDDESIGSEPPREAQITPASHRFLSYQEELKGQLAGLRWKGLDAIRIQTLEQALQSSLEASRVERFLNVVENDHRRLLQALEQAREVIRHSSQESGSDQQQILQEALTNVTSLLSHWDHFEPEWKRQIISSAGKTCGDFYLEVQNACQDSWPGHLRHRVQRFSRGARERGDGMGQILLLFGQRSWDRATGLAGHFLIRIGWTAAPGSTYETVVRRPGLAALTAPRSEVEIPAIYRRLFRMEAVSDSRFLLGRERELAALDEAYQLWQEGRPVSVLVTGHRGSGKTSLINCAFRQLPAETQLVRSDFSQRCITVVSLEAHLSQLLGLEPQANLEQELAARQRVIVLEEVERTFLRRVDGYEAAHHLLRLIACSSRTTLWVLVMNRVSFELLHAALAFGDPFSHRIDTAAVRPEVLQQAVLSRHNLSGLRLYFPSPTPARWWKPQVNAESEYFKAFSARTEGVFRTAFEVWQDQIEKVQAGVLFMAPIVARGLTRAVEVLNLQDLFVLVAILQHGSLEAAELAEIFSLSPGVCQAQLDELVARELIAEDPKYPGVRIRPEAGPVIRAVLYQKNLI